VNTNLLNNLFDLDKNEIVKINKKSVLLLTITCILIITLLFCIKRDNYYINEFTTIDDEIILLIDKDFINVFKTKRKIIISNIELDYSINTITPVDDNYMVNIKINHKINNIKTGKFKILLGKESLFGYIYRIITR